MINTSFLAEEDTIYIQRTGQTTLDDMLELVQLIDNQLQGKKEIFIIDDTRESNIEYNRDTDLKKIISEIEKGLSRYKAIYVATIVDDPQTTAFALLYEKLANQIPDYHFQVVSTMEAAKGWLDNFRK